MRASGQEPEEHRRPDPAWSSGLAEQAPWLGWERIQAGTQATWWGHTALTTGWGSLLGAFARHPELLLRMPSPVTWAATETRWGAGALQPVPFFERVSHEQR